jgi:hypothetical protein
MDKTRGLLKMEMDRRFNCSRTLRQKELLLVHDNYARSNFVLILDARRRSSFYVVIAQGRLCLGIYLRDKR